MSTMWAPRLTGLARFILAALAAANLLLIAFLWFNHAHFPLNLDLMEGAVLQHFRRAVNGLPIYPAPTSEYVPLAYNPLYYVISIPFGWVFGVNLFTLRLVSMLGMLGSGLILWRVVQERTGSRWWGLMAAGLFAAAYRVMDAYLDSAHSDAWLLCSALLGTYLIDRYRSRSWTTLGVVILIAAFWFKQQGALFAIGGLVFLTWREGPRQAWSYWLIALALGPLLYLFAGPRLFGSHFHYFTWGVPSQWTRPSMRLLGQRYALFILRSYPVLALAGGLCVVETLVRKRTKLDVWQVQFVTAGLTGIMGTLDAGSSDNVYIPMGTWFILVGTLALHQFAQDAPAFTRYRMQLLGLLLSFAFFVYDPRTVIASPRADQRYAELIEFLQRLDGAVYAPWLGQLPSGYTLYPAAHWVALDDLARGPERETEYSPVVRQLLAPALRPERQAFVLANYPLDEQRVLTVLKNDYVLETDLGNRFEELRVLPKRWDHGFPRYLYRYAPDEAGARVGRDNTVVVVTADHLAEKVDLSEEHKERLRALGYLE